MGVSIGMAHPISRDLKTVISYPVSRAGSVNRQSVRNTLFKELDNRYQPHNEDISPSHAAIASSSIHTFLCSRGLQ